MEISPNNSRLPSQNAGLERLVAEQTGVLQDVLKELKAIKARLPEPTPSIADSAKIVRDGSL